MRMIMSGRVGRLDDVERDGVVGRGDATTCAEVARRGRTPAKNSYSDSYHSYLNSYSDSTGYLEAIWGLDSSRG